MAAARRPAAALGQRRHSSSSIARRPAGASGRGRLGPREKSRRGPRRPRLRRCKVVIAMRLRRAPRVRSGGRTGRRGRGTSATCGSARGRHRCGRPASRTSRARPRASGSSDRPIRARASSPVAPGGLPVAVGPAGVGLETGRGLAIDPGGVVEQPGILGVEPAPRPGRRRRPRGPCAAGRWPGRGRSGRGRPTGRVAAPRRSRARRAPAAPLNR